MCILFWCGALPTRTRVNLNLVNIFAWMGTGWRQPGRIGAGGGRETGGDGAGCGSHVRAGGGRRMRDIKFFNDFLVPF